MKRQRSQAKPKRYPSDLTHTQWKRLKRLLPEAKPGGRPRSVDLREVLNGIFYITRGGCAWRMMPKDLPPWSTCYDYFYKWRNNGIWSSINDALRTQVRHGDGRGGGGPLGGYSGSGRCQTAPEEVGREVPPVEEDPGGRDLQRRDRGVGQGTRRLDLRVGRPPRGREEVQGAEVALGRRADVRLAGPLPPLEQGLRGVGGVERVLDLSGNDPFDAPTS